MPTFAEDPAHFVPMDKIPVIDIKTTLGRAYDVFGQRQVGGLILRNRAQPVYYVTAPFLESAAREVGKVDGLALASRLPLDAYLEKFMAEAQPIQESAPSSAIVNSFPIEVVGKPVLFGSAVNSLLRGTPRVYSVVKSTRQAGWLLSRERLASTVILGPPVWICMNPERSHKNYFLDHGKCSRCEYPLKK